MLRRSPELNSGTPLQAQIVLTLSAAALRPLIQAEDPRCPSLAALPGFTQRELQLRGLNLPSGLLAGRQLPELDRLRDAADKASCPCLVLVEDQPLAVGDPTTRPAVEDRIRRLAAAANRLGCRDIAIRVAQPPGGSGPIGLEEAATGVKAVLHEMDRHDLNLLLVPHTGLTDDPVRLTELIKKVGGFRIGSLPSFGHAHATGELEKTLRRLAPYAESIDATVVGFEGDRHKPFDLAACVESVKAVGYVNTLALDYAGTGDVVEDLQRARGILEAAVSMGDE